MIDFLQRMWYNNKYYIVRKDYQTRKLRQGRVIRLDFDSFFAGIEPGGLKDIYEIKILVCYLLYSVKEPLTKDQIDAVLQGNHLVNYFSYATAYQELLESRHISETQQDGKKVLQLNELGKDTAIALKSNLPLSLKNKVVSAGMEILSEMKMDKVRQVEVEKIDNGYIVRLVIHDDNLDLLDIKLFAPDEEQVEIIKQQFSGNTIDVYRGIISLLIKDRAGLEKIAEQFDLSESKSADHRPV